LLLFRITTDVFEYTAVLNVPCKT